MNKPSDIGDTRIEPEKLREKVKTEIMVGDDIHLISSESDMLRLMEVMKAEGRFGDPIMCPMCGEAHKLNESSFETPEECIFYKAIFENKLDAVETMKKFDDFVKTRTSARKVYLHDRKKPLHRETPAQLAIKEDSIVEIMPLIKASQTPEKPISSTKQLKEEPAPKIDTESEEKINRYGINTTKLVNKSDILKVISIIEEKRLKNWSYKHISYHFNHFGVPSLSGKIPWNANSMYQFMSKHKNINNVEETETVEENNVEKIITPRQAHRNFLINEINKLVEDGKKSIEIYNYLNKEGIKTLSGNSVWTRDNFAWFKHHYITSKKPKKNTNEDDIFYSKDVRKRNAIKEIKELQINPKQYTYLQISKELNKKNIPTLSGKKKWNEKTLSRFINAHIKNTDIDEINNGIIKGIVDTIVKLKSQQKTLNDICNYLNMKGMKTPAGKSWNIPNVKYFTGKHISYRKPG